MSDPLTVAAGERGLVRLFALDLPHEQAEFLREPGATQQLLGASDLDDSQIDVIRINDLEELGLSGYLVIGLGVPEDQIRADEAMLDGLKGYVLAVRSKAFKGQACDLTPDPRLDLIATYREKGADWGGAPMTAESAKPFSAAKPSPREERARARRIGGAFFAVVMIILLFVLLRILL